MDETKEKLNWQRLAITAGIVLVTALAVGGTVWYLMDQNAKSVADSNAKSITALQKQVNELKTTIKATTPALTPPTETADKLEVAKNACINSKTNVAIKSTDYIENTNGKFIKCSMGYTDGPTGYASYAVNLSGTWEHILDTQDSPSANIANQYKLPKALSMYSIMSGDAYYEAISAWKY